MPRAFDKAYRAVRDGVIAGRFPPAHRITEQEVAEVAGVSRTPVREALRRLHAEGIVDFRPNQGAMVTAWSADETDEIFELRAMFESHVARRAAQRATPAQISSLQVLAESQQSEAVAWSDGSAQRLLDLDAEFRRVLHESAGSERLSNALASVLNAVPVARCLASACGHDPARTATHSLELVRALERRDPEWAAACTRSHVLRARDSTRP